MRALRPIPKVPNTSMTGPLPPHAWGPLARWLARRHPAVCTIAPEALASWLGDVTRVPPLLVDVREPAEQSVSTLPGARCVASEAEAVRALRAAPPSHPVVVYCAVGVRSARAAEALQRAGHREVFNLQESIFGWANRGLPLVSRGRPTILVHPYDATWAALLAPARRAPL